MSRYNYARIRDHMDDILEARGYYRRHVARDGNSVFRSLSDVLFHTQRHHGMLQHCLRVFRKTGRKGGGAPAKDKGSSAHVDLRDLVDMLGVRVDLVETNHPDISTIRFSPRSQEGHSEGESVRRPLLASKDCVKGVSAESDEVANSSSSPSSIPSSPAVLLCFTGPSQYDPVYPKKLMDSAALVQSILYMTLYCDVFKVPDAMEAAKVMLCDSVDPVMGKPEVYDKEFEGTALEALQHFLIPFPYKVAKALDPESYRNIEFDVWVNEHRSSASPLGGSPSKSESGAGGPLQTIGALSCGTPCVIRDANYGDLHGFVKQPTSDRRHMEVYLPLFDTCAYVLRKHVLPLRSLPSDILPEGAPMFPNPEAARTFSPSYSTSETCPYLPSLPAPVAPAGAESPSRPPPDLAPPSAGAPGMSPAQVKTLQSRNLNLTARQDPTWLAKSDFSVPPPPFYRVGPPLVAAPGTRPPQSPPRAPPPSGHATMVPVGAPAALGAQGIPASTPEGPMEDPAIVGACSIDQNGNFVYGISGCPLPSYSPHYCPVFPSATPIGDFNFGGAVTAQHQSQVFFYPTSGPSTTLTPLGTFSPVSSVVPNYFPGPTTPLPTPFPFAYQQKGFQFPSPPQTPSHLTEGGKGNNPEGGISQ